MIRQRVSLRVPLAARLVSVLGVLFCIALLYYGVMIILLAVKVSPHTVNEISAYRSLFHHLSDLRRADFTTAGRLIAGIAGFLVFLFFALLALRQIPRPYLARGEIRLDAGKRGHTTVAPGAIESLAEAAGHRNDAVARARGRLADGHLVLNISVRRPGELDRTLNEVQASVREELERHGLPVLPTDVILTRHDPPKGRELA